MRAEGFPPMNAPPSALRVFYENKHYYKVVAVKGYKTGEKFAKKTALFDDADLNKRLEEAEKGTEKEERTSKKRAADAAVSSAKRNNRRDFAPRAQRQYYQYPPYQLASAPQQVQPATAPRELNCYGCGRTGHMKAHCPTASYNLKRTL